MEATPDFFLVIRQLDAGKTVRIAACVPHGFLIDVYPVLLSPLKLEPPVIHDILYYPYEPEHIIAGKGFPFFLSHRYSLSTSAISAVK